MKATAIDQNFVILKITDLDAKWYDVTTPPFSLHGVMLHPEDGLVRMPISVAKNLSAGRVILSKHLSGGRVRFRTDSPYVAVKCTYRFWDVLPHMPISGTHGFAVYKNGRYCNFTAPTAKDILEGEESGKTPFGGIINLHNGGKMVDVDLYLPLYSGVWDLQIGLADDCKIETHVPYKYQTPILFYGSSITQGACATHAGNDYVNTLSRMLNSDIWNLGFSGGAKGEKVIADYMASLNPSVYVLDYDHNAPDVEHLRSTHYSLYQTIRTAHKATPIVLISKPDFFYRKDDCARRDVIRATYQKAVDDGDQNVYFIDGETLFWDEERYACSVDATHPNDLGFYRMAKTIYPVLKGILEKTK